MRVIFNEELKAVADDLDHMVKGVRKAINGAGDALLNQNLEAAQAVIDGDIEIDALEASVVDQCVKLLAKQNPVATDLRVVVSTMRLATTFERMGDLARHIAEAARRTYPASPLPAEAQPLFAEMQAFLNDVADQTVAMLSDRDTKTAEQIIINDDNEWECPNCHNKDHNKTDDRCPTQTSAFSVIIQFIIASFLFCDFYYSDVWKISILLCIIQSVSNYELIRNLKSCPVYVHIFHTAVWFIK